MARSVPEAQPSHWPSLLQGGRRLGLGALLGLLHPLLSVGGALDLAYLRRPRQTLLQLLLDLLGVLGLGLQGEGLIPLEARLPLPAHTPVGVAQMIVEHRVLRPQL